MTAGLPGTGIGGIFYLLLAVLMPVREFFCLLRGKSSLRRWRAVGLQLSFVAGILLCMWGEVWGLNRLLQSLHRLTKSPAVANVDIVAACGGTQWAALAAATASFISLAGVFIVVHLLRLTVRRPKREEVAANCANNANEETNRQQAAGSRQKVPVAVR